MSPENKALVDSITKQMEPQIEVDPLTISRDSYDVWFKNWQRKAFEFVLTFIWIQETQWQKNDLAQYLHDIEKK